MTMHPPGDRDIKRLIRDLLSNDHPPAGASDMLCRFAAQCSAFGLDLTATRFRDGKELVAANDSFPPGDNAA